MGRNILFSAIASKRVVALLIGGDEKDVASHRRLRYSARHAVEDLEQVDRDSQRESPDHLSAVQDCREFRSSRASVGIELVVAAKIHIAERTQRHVEDFRYFRWIALERRVGWNHSNNGRHDN